MNFPNKAESPKDSREKEEEEEEYSYYDYDYDQEEENQPSEKIKISEKEYKEFMKWKEDRKEIQKIRETIKKLRIRKNQMQKQMWEESYGMSWNEYYCQPQAQCMRFGQYDQPNMYRRGYPQNYGRGPFFQQQPPRPSFCPRQVPPMMNRCPPQQQYCGNPAPINRPPPRFMQGNQW